MKLTEPSVPSYDEMLAPTIQALRQLGGSGNIGEINSKVAELMELAPGVLDIRHLNTSISEVAYRLAWSRTYLKKVGLLENSTRAIWSLTRRGAEANTVDPRDIVKQVRAQSKAKSETPPKEDPSGLAAQIEQEEELAWQEQYLELLRGMEPAAFERLIQRMLRESGFIEVKVIGRTGDGGIDGFGIARVNGFLSFRVLFQCKRYQGAVTASEMRDFRGAMQGRTEKGLFATTGTFSREAVKEATRDGVPSIDLLEGKDLVQRLKELGLGVRMAVEVDKEWVSQI